MKPNRCMDTSMFSESTNTESMKMDMNMNMGMNADMTGMMGCGCPCMPQTMMCQPIMECPQVRCCHRVINYEVPHIIPCHTKMINHHVYRHTYQPCFSYSEEDECSEIYDQKCC